MVGFAPALPNLTPDPVATASCTGGNKRVRVLRVSLVCTVIAMLGPLCRRLFE